MASLVEKIAITILIAIYISCYLTPSSLANSNEKKAGPVLRCYAKYQKIKTECYASLKEVFASKNYGLLKHSCCAALKTTSDECMQWAFNQHPFKDDFKPDSAVFGGKCKQHCMSVPDPNMVV